MTPAMTITSFACPICAAALEPAGGERTSCINCGWRGTAMLFRPIDLHVDAPDEALLDDATCVFHPTKRAEAICAGTGDYICALCTIEHEGETYSAEYFSNAGAKKAAKAFDRKLERPDSAVILYMGLCFVPYVNFIWFLGWPVWVVRGWMKLVAARRLTREDALFARLVSPARIVLIGILLVLMSLILIAITISLLFALVNAWTEGAAG